MVMARRYPRGAAPAYEPKWTQQPCAEPEYLGGNRFGGG